MTSLQIQQLCWIVLYFLHLLTEFVEITFRVSHKAGIAHHVIRWQKRLFQYLTHKGSRSLGDHIRAFQTTIRVNLLYFFSHPMSEAVVDWLIWFNLICMISQEAAQSVYHYDLGARTFHWITAGFTILFVVEVLLKMYAFGIRAFLSDKFYIIDAFLVGIGFVGFWTHYIIHVQLIRALRLLRVLFKEFPQMRLLVLFMKSLLRSFFILLLAEFCVFYMFSQLGMALFDGLLGYEQIQKHMDSVPEHSEEWRFWWNHMDDADATNRY